MRDDDPRSALRASIFGLTMSAVGLTLLGLVQLKGPHPVLGWFLIATGSSAVVTAIVRVARSRRSSR